MKPGSVLLCMLIVMFGLSFADDKVDSSAIIFNDSIVHSYELEYYVDNWDSLMEYNKEKADEIYMPAKLIYRSTSGDSVVLDSIGVRYKGNSSYELAKNTPKKSFKFCFDEYDEIRGLESEGKHQTFFGLERLNFNNCVLDPSYMREKISYDIARKYMPTPRVAYATIAINGTPIGVYTQVEQVDKLFLERNFSDPDGNLYKAGDDGAVLEYKGPNQSTYESLYELKTNKSENNWMNFVNMLYKLNETDPAKFVTNVSGCLDLDNCIRHLAWTIVLSHFDSYTGSGRNYYMYDNPKTGRFEIIPWDLNLSFGQFSNGWKSMITNSPIEIENLDIRPLNRKILENDSLKSIYLQYLQEMIAGPASEEAIAAEADRLKAIIDEAVEAEPADNKFYSYEQYTTNIDSDLVIKSGLSTTTIYGIKSFPVLRNEELMNQILAGVSYRPATIQTAGNRLECTYRGSSSSVIISFSAVRASQSATVTICDSHGRVVERLAMTGVRNGKAVWKTGHIATGVYSIIVRTDGTLMTDRVVIAK